ncbi:D-xylose ABC transporter ATP-binding protein [Anoxybacter fermentans]|uniref:D-xylose ABC transporter ATP-binding protein n=1 Tax=Anoxybacter fermentans TaxID=1323375 RepID=A0A3Q9HQ94_9FIRM|nr:xylose ABC transporter ATP-binding protein [Anoxybacter fermentans]AZR72186.1 D-xylose ABC transporter ATP-binding protein [Anoxybacter fermentans]
MNYILETKNITKDFPGVRALDRVSIKIKENEIHALCGENGAGKSTLIKILSGVYPYGTYEGQIFLKSKEQRFNSIKDAEKQGIAVIHQELTLFEELTVVENIFMGHEIENKGIIDWNTMYAETNKWLKKLKMDDVKPSTKIGTLGVGKQQLIEIIKALIKKSNILILDEPTASLTDSEVEILFEILKELRQEGVTCIYISHKLDEVFEIADSITVLRDGKSVGSDKVANLTEREVIKMMVGREINQMYPQKKSKAGEPILEIKNFNVYDPYVSNKLIIEDVNFYLRKGEILGIYGLVGAGRTELVTSIYGAFLGEKKGKIYLNNEEIEINSPRDALQKGIALVSEDRKRFGLIHTMDVKENSSIACLKKFKDYLSINKNREIFTVKKFVKELKIKTASLETNVFNLSGGNQQKVVLAKNLMTEPKVLILDEPTRGIDVGAKHEIYNLMQELAEKGVSIIMVSSELPEIIGMSDRILVLCQGRITGEFDNREKKVTQEDIMIYATGGK